MNQRLMEVFEHFVNSYELEIGINTSIYQKKSYFGIKSEPQCCRFCGKTYPETTFKTDSHLIPKFLGSKFLLSYFECDECNSQFKLFENDYANFIGAIRSITGIKGSSKNPKYSKGELTIYQDEENRVIFASPKLVEELEKGKDQILLPTSRNKFTPINVYKCLLKIGLCMIDSSEVSNFKSAFNFLKNDEEEVYNNVKNSMNIIRIFVPGPQIPEYPIVHLFKRKSLKIELPEKVVVIHIKNLKYQFALPLNQNDNHLAGKSMDVPMCPIILKNDFIDKFGDFQFEQIDLSSKNPVINKEEGIGLRIRNLKKHGD